VNQREKLMDRLNGYRMHDGDIEFYIDEHAYNRCKSDHQGLDLDDVLLRLKEMRFSNVENNDSTNPPLNQYESYIAYLQKSRKYKYAIVLYLLEEKPLIKTVYRLNSTAQERLKP